MRAFSKRTSYPTRGRLVSGWSSLPGTTTTTRCMMVVPSSCGPRRRNDACASSAILQQRGPSPPPPVYASWWQVRNPRCETLFLYERRSHGFSTLSAPLAPGDDSQHAVDDGETKQQLESLSTSAPASSLDDEDSSHHHSENNQDDKDVFLHKINKAISASVREMLSLHAAAVGTNVLTVRWNRAHARQRKQVQWQEQQQQQQQQASIVPPVGKSDGPGALRMDIEMDGRDNVVQQMQATVGNPWSPQAALVAAIRQQQPLQTDIIARTSSVDSEKVPRDANDPLVLLEQQKQQQWIQADSTRNSWSTSAEAALLAAIRQKATTDSTGVSTTLESEPQEHFFHGMPFRGVNELQEDERQQWHDNNNDVLSDASPVSNMPAKGRRMVDGVSMAISLLRTSSEKDWAAVEHLNFDEIDDDEIKEENDQTSAESEKQRSLPFMSEDAKTTSGLDSLHELLQSAQAGNAMLTTSEYNAVISLLAVSLDLELGEALEWLMQVHRQMLQLRRSGLEDGGPDAVSYEILLLAFSQRLLSHKTAQKLVTELLKSSIAWTPKTLEVAMQICERRNLTVLSRAVLRNASSDEKRGFKIPIRVFRSFLHIAKGDDNRSDAIEVMKMCLEEHRNRSDDAMDDVLIEIIQWPTRDRRGQPIDNSSVLATVIDAVSNTEGYMPSYVVVKRLIMAGAKGARTRESRWSMVRQAFDILAKAHPNFFPDYEILAIGIDASEALRDSELAVDLISRVVKRESARIERIAELSQTPQLHDTPSGDSQAHLPTPRVHAQSIVKAMEVCVHTNDLESIQVILDCCHQVKGYIPNHILHHVFSLALKSYANGAEPQGCVEIVEEMEEIGLRTGDAEFGTVMHAHALAGQLDEARALLSLMESELAVVSPGPATYGAFVLACIRARAWKDVMETYGRMKKKDVLPNATTYHGLLLASLRVGGKDGLERFLSDALTDGARLSAECCTLAVKMLVPGVSSSSDVSMDDIRKQLREDGMGEGAKHSGGGPLSLIRSLRMAEIEETRLPSDGLSVQTIKERREQAWHKVLEDVLVFSKARRTTGDV